MRYCWTTIYVKLMEESLQFYHELLGLEIKERFEIGEGVEIAMLGEQGSGTIELICNSKMVQNSEGISLGFEVDSIEESLQRMREKQITIKRGPFSPVPSTRFFFIEDPNGLEIQIVQHM